MTRGVAAILFLAELVILAGCGTPFEPSPVARPSSAEQQPSVPVVAPIETWREPARYEFVVDSQCGERSLIGRFRVRVQDGKPIGFDRLDASARRFQGNVEELPTLAELLAAVSDARNRGASSVKLTSDPRDGHPTDVEIDWHATAIDDEECYRIAGYVVDPSAIP
jgi:hypothetical protein